MSGLSYASNVRLVAIQLAIALISQPMLIPLTRKTFETLIPAVATGPQYVYCWGKFPALLLRLLISIGGVTVILLVGGLLGEGFGFIRFLLGIATGLYWLWGPFCGPA